VRKFKPTVDKIDHVLAWHHGFNDEELDFIPSAMLRTYVDYDIEYRLGQDCAEEAHK